MALFMVAMLAILMIKIRNNHINHANHACEWLLIHCLLQLQLWDTAGEEHYKAVTSVYYRGASAAFIVFDLTRPETFENVKSWMEEVYMKCGSDVLITIIGNKSDMPTKIDTQIIDDFTDLHMCQWFTTSAKDGTNVDDIFMTVTNNLIELQNQMLSLQSSNGPGSLFLSMDEQNFHPTYCCSYF